MAVTTNSLMALAMASMHSMKSEQPAAPADAALAAAGALGTRTAEDEAFLLANYPKCLEDVTEKWLGLLLRAEVTGKSIKVKLEAGVTGDAAIFNLEYAAGSTAGPATIVLKYAKGLEASRELAQDARMYEKETFFYRDLHSKVAAVLPIPGVFDVFIDPERPKEFFCIAMEDLSVDFQTCDQIKGKETHTHTPTCRTRRAVSAYCSLQAQAAPRPR